MRKEVLKKIRPILGEEHPSIITAMNNLAITLGDQGQLGKGYTRDNKALRNQKLLIGFEAVYVSSYSSTKHDFTLPPVAWHANASIKQHDYSCGLLSDSGAPGPGLPFW
jgi:hypothetical protein